ncbi:hypothetical protein [Candidatus Parabeggiatoa sp. HSG14]|uniref:hypothetical protein n=1 Tax=Candidatus Parabeggiatoa sp. HSG14 TaxID=3055593 RepID=UPI0025A90817|nr:hypothetical protein [Thiotrichales bacterium HSG14]
MRINLVRWSGVILLMTLYLTVQAAQSPNQIANQMYQQGKSPSYILNALVFRHDVDPLVAAKTTTKVVRKNATEKKLLRQLVNLTVAATFIAPDLAPEIVDTIQEVSVNRLSSHFLNKIAVVAMIVVPELARDILTTVTTVTDNVENNSNPLFSNVMVITFQNGFYSGERFPRDWNRGRSQSDLVEKQDDEKPTPKIITGGQFSGVSPH